MGIDRKTFYVVVHPEIVESRANAGDNDAIRVMAGIGQIPESQKGIIPWPETPNFPYRVGREFSGVNIAGAHVLECEKVQECALRNAGWKDVKINLELSIYQEVRRR